MKKQLLFTLSAALLLLSGCATKVTMSVLEPAKIDRAAKTKEIAILPFQNDTYSLSTVLEAEIANYHLDYKPYFTIINRRDLEKVIQEQKLAMSGLLNESKAADVGELLGAKAIITGDVTNNSVKTTKYKESRKRCIEKDEKENCTKYQKYEITCQQRDFTMQATIKIIDTTLGDLIYSDNYSKSSRYHKCPDQNGDFPETKTEMNKLALSISYNLVNEITPGYYYLTVTVLEDPDTDYNDTQEELLEAAVEYIAAYRMDKAEKLLKRLVQSTAQQSYVALYNLGVVYEAQGEFPLALEYYKAADELTIRPVEEINKALIRIQEQMEKQKAAKEQINS